MKKEYIHYTFAQFLEDNDNQREAIHRIIHNILMHRGVYLKDIARDKRDYAYLRKVALKLKKRGILKSKREGFRGRWYWTFTDDFIYIILKIADELKWEKRIREGKF